jgi:hypothetical protein
MNERHHRPRRWRDLLKKLRDETGENLAEAALTIGVVVLLAGALIAFVDWSRLTDRVGDALRQAMSAPFGGGGSDSSRSK